MSTTPSSSASAPAPQTTPTGAMILTLGLVAALCGLIIVAAYEGSYDAVQENRRIKLERAILKIVPDAKRIVPHQAAAGGEITATAPNELAPGAVRFYAAYDDAGALLGITAEGAAKGYADVVRVMFGYSPKCQCVNGIGVVYMRETPGIGDKIYTDRAFLANFEALDVKLNGDLSALANAVKTVKHGTKTNPWQIDAISGATITSRAIGKAINDTAQILLPRLVPNIEKLGKAS